MKVVRSDDPEKLNAHRKEYEILKMLDNSGVVAAKQLYEELLKGRLFMVMEFVDGRPILEEIAEKSMYEEADARILFKQFLLALRHVHDKGIAHRDLKPENILVTSDPSRTVKLLDFNVAYKGKPGEVA